MQINESTAAKEAMRGINAKESRVCGAAGSPRVSSVYKDEATRKLSQTDAATRAAQESAHGAKNAPSEPLASTAKQNDALCGEQVAANGSATAPFVPKIVAFCCNWCSYAGADLAGTNRLQYPAEVKIIRVPCSCRVNPLFILRAFGRGADGVIVCGCHPGDCHYTSGNYYARRRMTLLFSMLDFLGVEKGRTRVEWVSAAEGAKFAQTMNDFVQTVTKLGKNKRLEDLRCSNR